MQDRGDDRAERGGLYEQFLRGVARLDSFSVRGLPRPSLGQVVSSLGAAALAVRLAPFHILSAGSGILAAAAPGGAPRPPLANRDHFSRLPPELLLETFAYLDPQDLTAVGAASRPLRQIALDDILWRPHVRNWFHVRPSHTKPAQHDFVVTLAMVRQITIRNPPHYRLYRYSAPLRRSLESALVKAMIANLQHSSVSDGSRMLCNMHLVLRDRRDLAFAAVKIHGPFIQYFATPLWDDDVLGREAITQCGDAYIYLSNRLKNIPVFAMRALSHGAHFRSIPSRLLSNPGIAIHGIHESHRLSARGLPRELFWNEAFVRLALQRAGRYAGVIARRVPDPIMVKMREELGYIDESARDPEECTIL